MSEAGGQVWQKPWHPPRTTIGSRPVQSVAPKWGWLRRCQRHLVVALPGSTAHESETRSSRCNASSDALAVPVRGQYLCAEQFSTLPQRHPRVPRPPFIPLDGARLAPHDPCACRLAPGFTETRTVQEALEAPVPKNGYKGCALEPYPRQIERWVDAQPDITLAELQARLAEEEVVVSKNRPLPYADPNVHVPVKVGGRGSEV